MSYLHCTPQGLSICRTVVPLMKRGLIAAGLLTLMAASPAFAAPLYNYTLDADSYELAPGESITVPVYFQESVTDPDVSALNTEHGLAGASVQMFRTSAGAGFTITQITTNPAFDGPVTPHPFAGNAASFNAYTLDPLLTPPGVTPPTHGIMPAEADPGSGVWRVLLGTFTCTATGNPGDASTFQATMVTSISDLCTWDAFFGNNPTYATLGDDSIGSSEVTFTIMPEPSTLGFLGLAVSILVGRVPRNRNRS